MIDPSRKDLVEEFMACPIGRHSADLQQFLNVMRAGPLTGKYVLICVKPHREWVLARHGGGRGRAPEIVPGYAFTAIDEAERIVFRLRWKQLTGEDLV